MVARNLRFVPRQLQAQHPELGKPVDSLAALEVIDHECDFCQHIDPLIGPEAGGAAVDEIQDDEESLLVHILDDQVPHAPGCLGVCQRATEEVVRSVSQVLRGHQVLDIEANWNSGAAGVAQIVGCKGVSPE